MELADSSCKCNAGRAPCAGVALEGCQTMDGAVLLGNPNIRYAFRTRVSLKSCSSMDETVIIRKG